MHPYSFSRQPVALLLFALVFLGCSKKPDPIPQVHTTFQFTANGMSYIWDNGAGIRKDQTDPIYYLIATPANATIYDGLTFTISTPSLSETTYTYSPGVPTTLDFANDLIGLPDFKDIYGDIEIGDLAKVTISKLHNGYADGTFLATFSGGSSGSAKLIITNGLFKNVKISE